METTIENAFDIQIVIIASIIVIIALVFFIYYSLNRKCNEIIIVTNQETNRTRQKFDMIMKFLEQQKQSPIEQKISNTVKQNSDKVETPNSSVYNYITGVKVFKEDDHQSAYDDVNTVEPDNVEFIGNTTVVPEKTEEQD